MKMFSGTTQRISPPSRYDLRAFSQNIAYKSARDIFTTDKERECLMKRGGRNAFTWTDGKKLTHAHK